MRFLSTRDPARSATLPEALCRGLAPDGGLYVPEVFPSFSPADFDGCGSPAEVAERLLQPFFAGDPLGAHLPAIVHESFGCPLPLVDMPRRTTDDGSSAPAVLELFHGPTAAFKDFGARFLAACLARLPRDAARPRTILVATSGDTGGAVAAAFHRRPGTRVVVLYPRGLVSPLQERQLTCWGDNVTSLCVEGTFDDCQRLVKAAFAEAELRARHDLSSANSINVGRLLPQMVFYAYASLQCWRRDGRRPGFVVPSANLGNVLACIWARQLGLPIGDIRMAFNANRTVPDYYDTAHWAPRPSVATIACAMDVGDPSNMERLRHLDPEWRRPGSGIDAVSVSDDEIRARIRSDRAALGRTWCPHSATAADAYARLPPARRSAPWVLVATAHPAKFAETVEPLVGESVPLPESLARLLELPSHAVSIPATLPALAGALTDAAAAA